MIRIRHPQGTSTYTLEPTSTLSSLQTYIESQCSIPASDQDLKIGYPPKSVLVSSLPSSALLSSDEVGIKKGEQVIVARRAGSSAASVPATSSSSATPFSTTSSFGPKTGPQPIVSTATGVSSFGFGARRLDDGLTARNPSSFPSTSNSSWTKVSDGSVSVPLNSSGELVLKVVPDDNSCLFTSISFLLTQAQESTSDLRRIVADAIKSNPIDYPDVVLGQPREEYIKKILNPQTWGGAIEIAILSDHFEVEIDSVDVASGRVHMFGEGKGFSNRGVLVYSGIHYDALYAKNASGEVQTMFPGGEAREVLTAAQELCKELKKRRYYTDTSNFSLKCKVCGMGLKGEREAVKHAAATGHGDFGEV